MEVPEHPGKIIYEESKLKEIMSKNDPNTIYFYDVPNEYVKKEHVLFNNYEPTPFKDDKGVEWGSVEYYYQAHKFINFPDNKKAFEEIHHCPDSDSAKKRARFYEKEYEGKWDKEGWEKGKKKEYYMKRGLMFKFSQHKNILKLLLETGDKNIVERSPRDPYWGGMLPNSLNRLGEMIMELRENYRKNKSVFLEGADLEEIKVDL